jgi:hypothetical protein
LLNLGWDGSGWGDYLGPNGQRGKHAKARVRRMNFLIEMLVRHL